MIEIYVCVFFSELGLELFFVKIQTMLRELL